MTVLVDDPLIASMAITRALPDDPFFGSRTTMPAGNPARDGIVALPNEAALTTWIAHRSHRTLEPLFGKLAEVSASAISIASMWHIVGAAVVSAATLVPLLAGSSELTSGFGLPVRGTAKTTAGRILLN